MKFAVVKTGGKQYFVQAGDKIRVEKLVGEPTSKVTLEAMLVSDDKGNGLDIGTPILTNQVEAKVLRQGKSKKVKVVKYKNKTRYKRTIGHRQHFTELEIVKL
ncbi:MAG: 50S ribosomal protein L21 [Candidatus Komeilibacteria bacterium]